MFSDDRDEAADVILDLYSALTVDVTVPELIIGIHLPLLDLLSHYTHIQLQATTISACPIKY